MHPMKSLIAGVVLATALAGGPAVAAMNPAIAALQERWAEVNYQLDGEARLSAFESLAAEADAVTASYPDAAEAWIWSGIIKSTYAGAKGGLGALSLAKASRGDLEHALALDPTALNGSAYTSLGTLYFSVPGWPVGFGDKKKAAELLTRALEISPDGIDTNYFYAEFLRDRKDYEQARRYYLKAQAAPARPDRPLADQGRQAEIAQALAELSQGV